MRWVRDTIGRQICLLLVWVLLALYSAIVSGAEFVPRDALRYQRDVIREGRAAWGMEAPVATFASQIHQESRWNPDAKSAYAGGLTQFTPATAAWIAGVYPKDLGTAQPFNPQWAIRALAKYDKYLWDKQKTARTPCDRMAFTLSGYNGGAGWVSRDKALAGSSGADPDIWFGHVEAFNAGRAEAFFRENRGYPRRILLTLQPLYATWGPVTQCPSPKRLP